MKTSRDRSVTLLALGVLTFAGISLLRLYQVLVQWGFLAEILPFSPLYLALTGLVWGLVGLVLGWGLLRGRTWAPGFTRLVALAFLIYFWLDRLLLARQTTNWPFAAVMSLLVLALVFWTLSRRKARIFFGEWHEH
jgi:hypothetical protein